MKNKGNIVSIFSIITIMFFINLKAYSSTTLMACFSDSGAEFVSSETEGCASVYTDDSPETAAYRILKGYNGREDIKGYWDNQMYIIKLTDGDTSVLIKSKELETKKKIYISIAVSQYNDSVNINNVWKTVVDSFSFYGIQPSYSSLICGKYNMMLSENEMEEKVKEIFYKNNIKSVDKMSDKNIISVCGYMHGTKGYILDSGKKVNINIALRYSETYGCTYISIGSPIIAVEY